jgi:hypothetical protein
MNKLSTLECRTRIDHLEDDFENSHNFVAQVFTTCILFFLLAYNQNLMIFGKNYAFHRKNMFFLSIIFSLICVVLSFQYFILYYKHYTNLDNLCDFKKLLPTTYIFRYQIPLIVSIGFIIISLGLSVMIFMNIFS